MKKKRAGKRQGDQPAQPDYTSMTADQLRDQAGQTLADFAMGKLTAEKMNARTRKANERIRALEKTRQPSD